MFIVAWYGQSLTCLSQFKGSEFFFVGNYLITLYEI